jgi:hypothetical protein
MQRIIVDFLDRLSSIVVVTLGTGIVVVVVLLSLWLCTAVVCFRR